jgi:peptidoglycan glycosyltransferase
LGYWGVVSQESLATRQDNPRRVLAEQSIRQGEIVDRDGTTLVASLPGEVEGQYVRRYLYPEAAPVVGYYSLRHGTGGIENSFATTLHGERFLTPAQVWISRCTGPRSGDASVTVSLPIQRTVARRSRASGARSW